MNGLGFFLWLALSGLLLVERATEESAGQDPPSAAEVIGSWTGLLEHAGESRSVGLTFEPADNGPLKVRMSTPAIHLWDAPVGAATLEPGAVRIGRAFVLSYDRSAGTLTGVIPSPWFPFTRFRSPIGGAGSSPNPDPSRLPPLRSPCGLTISGPRSGRMRSSRGAEST